MKSPYKLGMVPDDTLIGHYMRSASRLETAIEYDFWGGVQLLSNIIGRRTYIDRPVGKLHLNWYVVLTADSGLARKSTAVRMFRNHALNELDQFYRSFGDGDLIPIESRTTPEEVERRMLAANPRRHYTTHVLFCASEMVSILGRESYMRPMPGLLTDLFDCPDARGPVTSVYTSLFSASTPSWLLRAINPDVIEGGFTSRTMFIVADTPKASVPWGLPLDPSTDVPHKVLELRRTALHPVSITDKALTRFSSWYGKRKITHDPFLDSFTSREHDHVLRLAGVLCVNDYSMMIQTHHIDKAVKVISYVKETSSHLFAGTADTVHILMVVDRIRRLLVAAGMDGLRQTNITKMLQNVTKAATIRVILEIMHELEMVQKFELADGSRGRPAVLWRATRDIYGSDNYQRLVDRIGAIT